MADNQAPSRNPADESSLTGVLRQAIRKEMQSQDGMMPYEVVSYDRATNRATLRPLIQMLGSDGEKVDRAQIASIRVLQPGNGAFSMSLPIKPGDKGWLLAADRDLSLFQQDLDKQDVPNTARMKSFQDGIFMPDAMKMGDVPGGEGDNVVIGANDGSAYISFNGGEINLVCGGNRLTLSGSGLSMNGINIGDTHTHGGVVIGTDDTLPPNA